MKPCGRYARPGGSEAVSAKDAVEEHPQALLGVRDASSENAAN